MNEHYTIYDAGWIMAKNLWPEYQVSILCKAEVGKNKKGIDAYFDAYRALEYEGLTYNKIDTDHIFLYDDGEQEPFLIFERSDGRRMAVWVSSLTLDSLSKIDDFIAIESIILE
jgi:hypothetical protein